MKLSDLLKALRAENAAAIVLFNDGSALLVPEPGTVDTSGDSIHFHSLADLEKNFAQVGGAAAVAAPPGAACTCHHSDLKPLPHVPATP